jgi:glutamate racemase
MNEHPTLVIDWGIGGLSVWRQACRLRPGTDFIYVSDTGYTPYGKLADAELVARLEGLVLLAAERWDCRQVLLACNAASTALDALQQRPWVQDFALSGMVEAGIAVTEACGKHRIGIVGGRRTIKSGIYARRLSALGFETAQSIAQPLSALVEAGELSGDGVRSAVAGALGPLGEVDALLLACTHYPALTPIFAELLPDTLLLDPANAAARALPPDARAEGGGTRFFTTGSPQAMRRAAALAFQVDCAPETLQF